MVVALTEHNFWDDSDFAAIVWDAETGRPKEVTYATTRGWTYHNSARVDATPEVATAYEAYKAALAAKRVAATMAYEAQKVAKGKVVKVVKGRKVPVGTTGEVIWYGDGKWSARVGIKDADGTVYWTAASNVEVVPG
jgi:hypothetical protein